MPQRSLTFPLVLLLVLVLAACREDDGIIGETGGSRAFVVSDPPGARILVDERATGRFTPDTVGGLAGQHNITARFDSVEATYGFNALVLFPGSDTTIDITGPLLFRCAEVLCYQNVFQYYAVNRARFASNPVGVQFLEDGTGGQGLLWPSVSNNGYVSGGMPVFAGMMLGDTVSLGAYDTQYFAGRPAPTVTQSADSVAIRQTTWILPPAQLLQFVTARGLAIDQHVISVQRVDDVVAIRLVFRNITADPLYQRVDPAMPAGGTTITNAYIGFLLDPDIGTPMDDAISYDPELDLVFAYDAHFEEANYGSGYNLKPGLVGLRVLEAPQGAGVALNGWARSKDYSADWKAGTITEGAGWLMLSGTRSYQPDHPSRWIGHLPPETGDMRLTVTAGPVNLVPGDSAAITIAIVLAEPAAGTFTSGNLQDPGNPTDPSRQLLRIAAQVLERARAADEVLASFAR
jgi:hypothetical protein